MLRILDSKDPLDIALVQGTAEGVGPLPLLKEFLSEDSVQRFQTVTRGLDALGIAYTLNPFLMRGLDYYSHTAFEFVDARHDGRQSAVLVRACVRVCVHYLASACFH